MSNRLRATGLAILLAAWSWPLAGNCQEPAESPETGPSLLDRARAHLQKFEMRTASDGEAVELLDRSLLTFGDSARANQNGTVWAFGKSGRPAAIVELYQGTEANARWVHAVSLTGLRAIKLKTPAAIDWQPAAIQIDPEPFRDGPAPDQREQRRLRQLKELARRFSAHEFWDPDNSRFELRLLEQPVLRYQDAEEGIHDGAVFLFAHGTNPEAVVLIEALGKDLESAQWHYSLARLGSAELHVELGGKEVWKRDRAPGVVGQPTDPYWLFFTPAEAAAAEQAAEPK